MNTMEQAMNTMAEIRLTSFSHGGGCGCKIAPSVLTDILRGTRAPFLPPELLVGVETGDDAAVYRLNSEQALVATTDFFMPIVDDPFDFGRIAATNAISDVYAMGGTPIMALALVGMPIDKLPVEVIRRILDGGESICTEALIPIAGGHTIDSVEPIYGLVVMGLVHPDKIKTNRGARAGDVLILGKPLGVGVLSAAVKKNKIDASGYRELIASTTKLNTPGRLLSGLPGVHAMTDVTGFGLLGHLLPMCRAAKLRAEVAMDRHPVAASRRGDGRRRVRDRSVGAQLGVLRRRGRAGRRHHTRAEEPADRSADERRPAGACAPETTDEVLSIFRSEGFDRAAVIGELREGPARVAVA